MQTVVAVYDNFRMAHGAVRELVEYGFEPEQISVSAAASKGAFQFLESQSNTGLVSSRDIPTEQGTGARLGAGIGAAAGFAAALAGSLGGELAAVLTAAAVWLVLGSLTGALLGRLLAGPLDFGIPEKEAEQYAEDIRQGSVLVTVQADQASTGLVHELLGRFRPRDITDQAPERVRTGWEV